jgi:predicted ABC-type sugar transport system permease subunit
VSAVSREAVGRLTTAMRRRDTGLNPGLVVVLVVIFVALSLWSPYFLTGTNLLNIGKAVAIVGIVAVGETIVIISGGFDLSVGRSWPYRGCCRPTSSASGCRCRPHSRRRSPWASRSDSPTAR